MAEERSNYSALALMISAIIDTGEIDLISRFGLSEEHIYDEFFRTAYSEIQNYYKIHHQAPSKEALVANQGACAQFLESDMYIPAVNEVPEHIRDLVWEDFIYHQAVSILNQSAAQVNVDPRVGMEFLKSAVAQISTELGTIGKDIIQDTSSRLKDYKLKSSSDSWFYGTGFPELDNKLNGGLSPREELVVVFARTGVGKEQPLYSKVLTPEGWKRMGDLKLKDNVITGTGDIAPIVAIFPQGKKSVYRVVMHDGFYVDAGLEHLWKVYKNHSKKPSVVSTEEIISDPCSYRIPAAPSSNFYSDINFNRPYELGVIIACCSDIVRGDDYNFECWVNKYTMPSPVYNIVRKCVTDCKGFWFEENGYISFKHKSPLYHDLEQYLNSPSEICQCNLSNRSAIFEGVCDVSGRYRRFYKDICFEKLPRDCESIVRPLIRSLGGTYKKLGSGKITAYLKNNPYRKSKYKHIFKPCAQRKLFWNIKNVIDTQSKYECQCLMIDHPDHTYITDGYTVTHNTWVMTKMLHEAWRECHNVGLIEPEMTEVKVGYRFDTIHAHYSNRDVMQGKEATHNNVTYENYLSSLPETSSTKFMVAHPKDFSGSVTVSKLRTWCINNDIKILGIDGISYMVDERGKPSDSNTVALTHISADLMQLSVELEIPVIIVVQSNREGTAQGGKLALENIRDSDGIAYSASKVIGLYKKRGALHIQLLKNRDGESDYCLVYDWDINTGLFNYLQEGELEGEDESPDSGSGHSFTPRQNNNETSRPSRVTEPQSYSSAASNNTAVF